MKKYMEIAGYFAIMSFIVVLLLGLFIFYNVSGFAVYEHIAEIIIFLFLFLGFLSLGKFSKNKFLIFMSWTILILSLITNIFSILIQINPNILFFLMENYNIPTNLNSYLLILLPAGIVSGLQNIFLGLSLLKIKEVKFAKETGFFSIIIGVLYSIFYFILSPIALSANLNSWIYQFFLKVEGSQVLLGIIAIILYGILAYLESTMFFDASKKFEK